MVFDHFTAFIGGVSLNDENAPHNAGPVGSMLYGAGWGGLLGEVEGGHHTVAGAGVGEG